MKLGISLRLMGAASQPGTVRDCALAAEAAAVDDLWVPDHIAIPPDDAEGSEGRYLDPLASLSYLAGITSRIGLGTGVLILPYRPALPTAKTIATVQELSGGRLRLGVGVGWMKSEFKALGIPREERGRRTDGVLDLLARTFSADDDLVSENGQPFLFRPNPARPPIYVGGDGGHAFERAIRFGDGWFPMPKPMNELARSIEELTRRFEDAGRGRPEVVTFGGLGGKDPQQDADKLAELERIGVTGFITGGRYDDLAGFQRTLDALVAARDV